MDDGESRLVAGPWHQNGNNHRRFNSGGETLALCTTYDWIAWPPDLPSSCGEVDSLEEAKAAADAALREAGCSFQESEPTTPIRTCEACTSIWAAWNEGQ
jgi:hypothetical protein